MVPAKLASSDTKDVSSTEPPRKRATKKRARKADQDISAELFERLSTTVHRTNWPAATVPVALLLMRDLICCELDHYSDLFTFEAYTSGLDLLRLPPVSPPQMWQAIRGILEVFSCNGAHIDRASACKRMLLDYFVIRSLHNIGPLNSADLSEMLKFQTGDQDLSSTSLSKLAHSWSQVTRIGHPELWHSRHVRIRADAASLPISRVLVPGQRLEVRQRDKFDNLTLYDSKQDLWFWMPAAEVSLPQVEVHHLSNTRKEVLIHDGWATIWLVTLIRAESKAYVLAHLGKAGVLVGLCDAFGRCIDHPPVCVPISNLEDWSFFEMISSWFPTAEGLERVWDLYVYCALQSPYMPCIMAKAGKWQ